MVMGRPREYDRDQIADDLIEWSAKEDSINVNKFCGYYKTPFPTEKLWVWSKEDENFRHSYEIAKARVGARREEWLNDKRLHVKAYDLAQFAYDSFLRQDRNDFAAYQAALRLQEEEKKISPEDKERFDAFITTFRALQKQEK